jgi:hypothetical protein
MELVRSSDLGLKHVCSQDVFQVGVVSFSEGGESAILFTNLH